MYERELFLEKSAFQSGFCKHHSHRQLKVFSDILMTTDNGDCTVFWYFLTLLRHFTQLIIHFNRVQNFIGISGPALNWFSSYLSDRSFSVWVGGVFSDTAAPNSVPQESLGLSIFPYTYFLWLTLLCLLNAFIISVWMIFSYISI